MSELSKEELDRLTKIIKGGREVAIREDGILPIGTIVMTDGLRCEIESFEAAYYLKEIDKKNVGCRRLVVPVDTISELDIYGAEKKTYEELQSENALLKSKIDDLTDQVHIGHGGRS